MDEEHASRKQTTRLALAALGVVYGDIGTSPLYAIRECFGESSDIEVTVANVFGILSLVFWSLVIVVSVKYLGLVLRADNDGEGGALALTALLLRERTARGGRAFLVAMGLFAASLLYGDGMITPAISVLGAVEGLAVVTHRFEPWIAPITIAILLGLFMVQSRGTGRVGTVFGPVMLVWFTTLAALGVAGLVHAPEILLAVDPRHAVEFVSRNRLTGMIVLGSVFLVVTGAEALYADLGHFGKRPIRLAWFAVAFPALLLNYFGQGALLLGSPDAVEHPFYSLAPDVLRIPLVVLATAATIIASQAVISGAFSITNQAIQLGYCPRMSVRHTSSEQAGQIYIPAINWILMLATIALVLGFRSSGNLAAAYGVAVTTTMTVTTLLFYVVARERWRWPVWVALPPVVLFLIVDLAFFGANATKIPHGAWFPLAIGGAAYLILSTWKKGRRLLAERRTAGSLDLDDFIVNVTMSPVPRTPGKAVFLTRDQDMAPASLLHNLKHNGVLHEQVALLSVQTQDTPRVPRAGKVTVESVGNGFYKVTARHGFMEEASVPHFLALAHEADADFDFDPDEVTFFLSRETIRRGKHASFFAWREQLFTFLLRNALGATTYYHVPPRRVIEVGSQIEL